MPRLNLNTSVLSVDSLVIGLAKLKLKGPIGVNQSIPTPTAVLIVPLSVTELV